MKNEQKIENLSFDSSLVTCQSSQVFAFIHFLHFCSNFQIMPLTTQKAKIHSKEVKLNYFQIYAKNRASVA